MTNLTLQVQQLNFILHMTSLSSYKNATNSLKQNENFAWWMKKRKGKNTKNKQNNILKLLPAGKSVWINNFGYAFINENPNIISFENKKNKKFLEKINHKGKILYSENSLSKTTLQYITKYQKPTSVVLRYGHQYTDLKNTAKKLNDIIKYLPNTNIFIILEFEHIYYNRLRYTQKHFTNSLLKLLSQSFKFKELSFFDTLLYDDIYK